MEKAKKNQPEGEVVEYKPKAGLPVPSQDQSPEALIALAIDKGTSVDTMERLLAMRRELKSEAAKAAFDKAMADFQSECPVIVKTKKVMEKNGQTIRYQYAPIDSIIEQTKAAIAKHGLSYTIKTTNDEKTLTVTCRVTHLAGHSEESSFTVPIGSEQFMSDVQKYGARSTFAKRYAYCDAFGIVTGDDDNDSIMSEDSKKKDTTNYVDKLKMALNKRGAKSLTEALSIFNEATGSQIKAIPTSNDEAKKFLELFNSSSNDK